MEKKQNLTQQSTHSPIKRNVKQHKINTKRTKARFSHLVRHPAWKQRDLFWFRCFINMSLTYLDPYPLTYSPEPTRGGGITNISQQGAKRDYQTSNLFYMLEALPVTQPHQIWQVKGSAMMRCSEPYSLFTRMLEWYNVDISHGELSQIIQPWRCSLQLYSELHCLARANRDLWATRHWPDSVIKTQTLMMHSWLDGQRTL